MSSLLKIGWTTKRIQPILVCLLVFLWNLLAQIGVASVGLTYSADPTTDQAILHPDQPIWIPDLSAFSTPTDRWPDERVQQTTANNLGVSSTAYIVGNTDDPSTPLPLPNSTYESVSADYWLESNATWKYIFVDTPPVPNHPDQDPGGPQTMSIFTDRSITSNATCTAYPMTYSLENNTWTFQGNDTELLPVPPTLDFATSFQASNDVATCNGDDRTASVQVYETGHISDDDTPSAPYWFYDCCVRVSEIANATDNKPQILANMSYTAAAAIGLQGYTDYDYDLQYQVYQNETYWGYPFNGDADGLSLRMAQFAIGVFVTAGYQNPMNSTIGLQPQQGTTISFDQFTLLIVNLSLIAGLHFACFIVCAFLANRVVIPDESPLSIARSLGPLVAKLGGRGGLLSSEEIAKILDTKVLYGLVEERNEGLRICFEDVPPVRAFPNGRYV